MVCELVGKNEARGWGENPKPLLFGGQKMSYEDKNGKSRPTHKDRGRSAGKVSFGDYGFARIELSAEDRERFGVWTEEQGVDGGAIDYLLEDGCKVSFSTDKHGGGVICSASQPDPKHENAGLVLTGRGGTAIVALAVLVYKDMVICGGESWRQGESEHGGGQPDIG